MTQEIKYKVATKFCGDTFIGDVWSINLDDGPATGECYIWLHSYGGERQEYDTNNGDSLMQYIGRKDINGKKIYNDFIVQCDLGIKYKVIFSNEWCAFMLIENKTDRQVVIYPEMKLEVIGNIHQHPELLEK